MLDLVQGLQRYSSRKALAIDGECVSYRDLGARIVTMKRQLEAYGVGPGGRVGLLMPNSVDMVVTLLATWACGAVVVPINTRYRSQEIAFVVAHSEMQVLLTAAPASPDAPDLPGRVLEAFPKLASDGGSAVRLPEAPYLRAILIVAGLDLEVGSRPTPSLDTAQPKVDADASGVDELLLIYTSGTTAEPKGCVHDVRAFIDTARLTADTMGVGEGDVVWDPLPLFHTGGLLPLLGALDRGATFCTAAHFDADEALALMARERVTAAYPAFSTLITALLDSATFEAADLSSVRWILAIGPPGLLERVQNAIPSARQVSCYGCTEIGGVVVYNDARDSAESRANTSGRSFPDVRVDICDPLGKPVDEGGTGEIVVRGPGLLRRYHRDGTSPFDEDGGFHTGDLGRIDEGGNLVFEGRLKDMLKVGGENVAASEIEFALTQHPAVTLAAVVPVPDERLTEVAAAFVELKPGHIADERNLIEFCESRLASFKVPRYIRFVTSWPMSATKIQKFRLRELIDQDSGNDRMAERIAVSRAATPGGDLP